MSKDDKKLLLNSDLTETVTLNEIEFDGIETTISTDNITLGPYHTDTITVNGMEYASMASAVTTVTLAHIEKDERQLEFDLGSPGTTITVNVNDDDS